MALINGLEGRRSVQSKLVLFTALFTILSAFSIGATVKSGDFNLDDSEFDFSENAEVAVWSEERPKKTENVSPNQPLNPGDELPLGVTADADTDSVPQFGEELELYSTQDGTDYQKITDYGFLNRHLKLENGELSFVVPSVEIEGSKGLNTEDAIQVEGRVYGEDLKQASDETEIDVSEYIDGRRGDVNLRQVREGGDEIYTVKVDKASPQVKNISKINSTAVRIQIEDLGAAKISNESFLTDNRKLENDVFSYEPITSELGTDAPGHKFRYLKDESSADEAVYLLLLDEKFEESKALEIFLNSPISDTQGNEITNLGLEGRVNDMNDQPPQVMTEVEGDEELTLGSTFTVNMYARSVDDVKSVSIDASEVSENGIKSKSQGLQIQKDCENDDWDSECIKLEKEFTVTRGSDGLNTIEVSASNENGKTNKEESVTLSIVPQDAQEIRVYDKEKGNHDGDIDTADVKFESEIRESSVNKNGWKLIGPESETEAVSAELIGGNTMELTFESDVDTTDANKVDVVYDSPQNDFLKTSNGARVPSINKGTIVETDEAAPVPVDYRLQESYDKAVLKFSEKITSATYEKPEYYEANVTAIEESKMAIVNINVGIGSPDEFEEEFSAEDGTDSGSVTKAISRSRAGEDSKFVVLNKGWNIAALPKPGDVEGTATTDKSLSEGEELSSLSCVEQTYRRVGSWSTGVSDLSHRYGTYVESNRPCILEFSAEDSDSPASIGNIDSSEVGQGWNLLSPYTGSEGFNWIDDEFSEDVDEDQIFAPEDAIEEDLSLSDDEDDLNRYDSYWFENEN
jgi:hypothetical protein